MQGDKTPPVKRRILRMTSSKNLLLLWPKICQLLSLQRDKTSLFNQQRGGVMMINCIWWWGFNSGALCVKCSPFHPGPLRPKVVVSVWVPSMGQMDLFANYFCWIGMLKTICIDPTAMKRIQQKVRIFQVKFNRFEFSFPSPRLVAIAYQG